MNLKYDSEISISIGRSRKETHWRNRDILWSLFVEKLSRTHQTTETLAEYMKANKSRQDEIKDIGGFVGGTLTSGHRKAGSIASRSLITLDIDNGDADVWDDFTLLYGNAAVVYSTHKHSPEKPRLRLVLPLDRPVTPTEYVPIARRIAGLLGIDRFDDTTFEPERLMYWPSTPKDIEYYFRYQDGPWLSADEVLNSYHNWRDSSEWPVSERQGAAIRREMKKQADPLEKPGIVGAFCRTYDIHKAIETFLPDVYEACDVDNRYTYKGGSTAAGLIIYDDKFAYSHHGTDPASGMLCNAFDLVRIHLFGLRDENVKENGTRLDRYPSYQAMEELCIKDKNTKRLLMTEKNKSAKEDFENAETDDEIWKDKLDIDKKGNCLGTPNNIDLILENDLRVKGCFAYDLFNDRMAILKMPYWRKDQEPFIRDDDEACLRKFFADYYRIEARQKITDGLNIICRKKSFHPVRDYLSNLVWDGVERLDKLFIDYLGAEDTELNRWLSRAIFTAAVYRTFEPGTKFDEMLTIVGPQGCGKSTFVEKMAVKKEWFSCSMPTPDRSDAAANHLRGKFIIEVGELVGIRKAELTAVKNFLSASADNFHAPYGKYDVHRPRQCVFFATTNEDRFLRDVSGDRRYWIVKVGENRPVYSVWDDLTPELIGLIWAEAVEKYKKRMILTIPQSLKNTMSSIQEEFKEIDEWQGIIEEFLDRKLPANWDYLGLDQRKNYFQTGADPTYPVNTISRDKVCIAEILNECPNLGIGQFRDRSISFRVCNIMAGMSGWKKLKKKKRFNVYGPQTGWIRESDQDDIKTEENIF